MLAVAGTTLLQGLAVRPLLALSNIYPRRSLSSRSGPLSLFICAADEASDQAGAALVTALKQLTGRQVELHGVGGRLLQDLGLQCVVEEDQLHSLAAAEVIPPTYKLLQGPGSDRISKGSYAKIFRDFIWEAALDGCRGRPSRAGDQQQQQQVGPGPQSSSTTASPGSGQLCYDAVVTVGSPIAAQMTLNFLHQAEKLQKAKLPVVVQYTVPGLWDHQSTTAAAVRWSKLVHHVMCSLPFEPALLHAAGVPSSFVGHPLLQQLLGSSSSTSSFGGKARLLSSLLKQQQQQQQQQLRQLPLQSHQQLFAAGDAAAFWKLYDATYALQQEAAAAEAEAQAQAAGSSNNSSSSSSGSSVTARQTSRRKQLQGLQRQHNHEQQRVPTPHQQNRLLLALLPGTTEAEVISSMAAFDQITQQLQESHPHLIATLHVPEILAKAAVMATVNFKVPVLVVTAGEKRAADALAAAAAAVSHPGPASLDAVAAGLPLVCVKDGSLLKGAWSKWRQRHALPYGSILNLLLGRAAVPEVNLWENGAVDAAVGAVRQLLAGHAAGPPPVFAAAAVSAAGDGSSTVDAAVAGVQAVQQQKVALQEALLQLVPPAQQQQQQGAGVQAVGSSWQLPAEAAARTLLELIELRQQQELSLCQSQPRQHTQVQQHDSSSTGSMGSSTTTGAAPVV